MIPGYSQCTEQMYAINEENIVWIGVHVDKIDIVSTEYEQMYGKTKRMENRIMFNVHVGYIQFFTCPYPIHSIKFIANTVLRHIYMLVNSSAERMSTINTIGAIDEFMVTTLSLKLCLAAHTTPMKLFDEVKKCIWLGKCPFNEYP